MTAERKKRNPGRLKGVRGVGHLSAQYFCYNCKWYVQQEKKQYYF